MAKKIICFVRNDNSNSGLEHVFEHSPFKDHCNDSAFCKEFIYYGEKENGSTNKKLILGKDNNNFLLFSKEKGAKLAKTVLVSDEWDMLWVHDSQGVSAVAHLLTAETYVIYHNQPTNANSYLSDRTIAGSKHAQHEPGDEYYKHLKDFINCWTSNEGRDNDFSGVFDSVEYSAAINKIVAVFEPNPLDVALIVLHKCLTEKPTCESEEIKNLKATLTEENVSSLKNSYDNLASLPMEKIESFIAFRDELLKIAILIR
jgi:hypothetical protein